MTPKEYPKYAFIKVRFHYNPYNEAHDIEHVATYFKAPSGMGSLTRQDEKIIEFKLNEKDWEKMI